MKGERDIMKFNKFKSAVLLACILTICALQCGECLAAATEEITVIAYRVEPPKSELRAKPSYFVGTFSLSSNREFVLPRKILDSLASCEVAVFQTRNIAGGMDQETLHERLMLNYDLNKLYSPEILDILTKKCKEANIELEVTPLKPWSIFFILIGLAKKDEPSYSIGKNLYRTARELKKKITYLEFDDAYIYDRIPLEIQVGQVELAATNMKSITDLIKKIEELYQRGDIDALTKASRFNSTDSRCARMELLWNTITIDGRIDSFFQLIEKHLSSGGAFITLSVEMLPGENGILARLRAKGYTITDASIINGKQKK